MHDKLGDDIYTLQRDDEQNSDTALINSVGRKLDQFSKDLSLYPYNSRGKFQGKLETISHAQIQPVLVICPDSIECKEISCEPWAIHQITKTRDIPKVTLVKGSDIYQNVSVLTGQCSRCKTLYLADRETLSEVVSKEETRKRRIYLISKLGRVFGLIESFQIQWLMACIASMHLPLLIWNIGIIALEWRNHLNSVVVTYGKHLFKSLHEL